MSEQNKRWRATITYVLDTTEVEGRIVFVDEIEDLQEIIERGPPFNAIDKIVIEYNLPGVTLLEASQL